jgi:phosphoenolpyruvate carboxylase
MSPFKPVPLTQPHSVGRNNSEASATLTGRDADLLGEAKLPVRRGPADASSSLRASRTRADKDQPLSQDIRYLGRLLGDVVREQEGDAVFDVIETIRQTAVRFRREDDSSAAQTLDKKLRSLSPEQTVSVVRAFSYFSHLANIAEDRHRNRRHRIHALAGSAAQAGTIAYALERLMEANAAATPVLQQFFNEALIVPVLTAHPTEVQRKSILDAQHDIARLLAERDQQRSHAACPRHLAVANADAARCTPDGG